MKRTTLTLFLVLFAGAAAGGDMTAEQKIAAAEKAAPPQIGSAATIVDDDGTVLREGDNGWTCRPNTMPGDGSPICYDAQWADMMAAMGGGEPFEPTGLGIAYMLMGDAEGSGVSNSDPGHPDPHSAHDYVEEAPHLMLIVPRDMLDGLTDDPNAGGPYVMWKDTPYAHIMVPIEDRD